MLYVALPAPEDQRGPAESPLTLADRVRTDESRNPTLLAVLAAAAAVGLLIIIVALVYWLYRRRGPDQTTKEPPVPAVQFDLTPRILVEESIDFVVPPLQSPRTLKAGAANFEFGSSEQLQMNLYEPMAREYRPPSVGFSLEHDRESRSLTVKLNGAKDIAPTKLGVNPVVKVALLPDKIRFYSRVAKDTTQPVFGDSFHFELAEGVPPEQYTLKFSLYDQDKLGRRVLLGKVAVPLKRTLHHGERWLPLTVQKQQKGSYGEVTVVLEHTEEAFIFTVVAARGLPKDLLLHLKMGVYINHRLYRKTRSGSFQALGGVKELSERLELPRSGLSAKDLSNLQLIISLCSRKKRLAKCHIGPRSSVEGIEHWAEMLDRKRAVRAHRLLPG